MSSQTDQDRTLPGEAFDQDRAFAAATGADAFEGGAGAGPAAGDDWRARLRNSRFGTVAVLGATAALVLGGAWALTGDGTGTSAGVEDSAGQVSSVDLEASSQVPPPTVGEPAADFTATTIDGTPVRLSELRGRPVWVLFGATWCAACRSEQPDVQAAAEKYGDDVVLLSVYLGENQPTVTDYSERLGITYPEVPDPTSEISASYRIMGVPSHFFVDADGILQDMEIGALHPSDIDEKIGALLADG